MANREPMSKTEIQARYDRAHARFIHLKLNKGTDADILARLEEVDSMQGYIKRLIREDIEKKQK